MLHALPITNVRLSACHAGPEHFKPAAEGFFCGACRQVVYDFTQASRADLERVRQATGGRFCGLFRGGQLAPPPRLRRRLRLFLVAAALVLLQGLSARQAWAQVQQAPPPAPVRPDTLAAAEPEVEYETRGGAFREDDTWEGLGTALAVPKKKKAAPARRPASKARPVPRRSSSH